MSSDSDRGCRAEVTASHGQRLGAMAGDLANASLDMASHFAAGATLWCAAPEWPAHSQHLAVEFVHPVIVGKRALPAVALDSEQLVNSLRLMSAVGDLLVAVARADDARVVGAMRRAPAWGLRSIWIGTGPRPPAGAADHVLWLDEDVAEAAHGGGFVLLYHLLWELTHVCFEHPGLLDASRPVQRRSPARKRSASPARTKVVSARWSRPAPGSSAQVRTAAGIEEHRHDLDRHAAARDARARPRRLGREHHRGLSR